MVFEAWERSGGWGIGFQQLGVAGTEVEAAQILRSLRQGEDLNILDGGFVFAKFGSDFGAFGVALTAVYLALAVHSALRLRRNALGRLALTPTTCFSHCLIVMYSLELFVRGGGYFTSGSLLLVTAFWTLRRTRKAPASTRRAAASASPAVQQVS
jgi:hypothetical protein